MEHLGELHRREEEAMRAAQSKEMYRLMSEMHTMRAQKDSQEELEEASMEAWSKMANLTKEHLAEQEELEARMESEREELTTRRGSETRRGSGEVVELERVQLGLHEGREEPQHSTLEKSFVLKLPSHIAQLSQNGREEEIDLKMCHTSRHFHTARERGTETMTNHTSTGARTTREGERRKRMSRSELEKAILSTQRAEAARLRYTSLTPRSGAKAAQLDQIEQLMAEADEKEDEWTPRDALRVAPDRHNEQPHHSRPTEALNPSGATESMKSLKLTDGVRRREVEEARDALHGLSPAEARNRLRQLQAQASEAAQRAVSEGARARELLDEGDLEAATSMADEAEVHATEARAARRMAKGLYDALQVLKSAAVEGAATPRGEVSLQNPALQDDEC
ncbi:MAG: hypothetical protein SGPRY_011384 [Prymnesium sp.]